jgi:hypothetical protein
VITSDKPDDQVPDREPHEQILSKDEIEEIFQFDDRERKRRRAPKVQVISKPGKPLAMDFPSPVEYVRFLSAFGTSEIAYAKLMPPLRRWYRTPAR